MADPAFVQVATGSAQSTTVSVSAPTGTISGDHQLIWLGVPSTSITVTSVPSGWTLERTQQNTNDATPFTLRCYKSSTATGSASFTVSSSTTLTAVRVTYRGGTGVETSLGAADASSTSNHAIARPTSTINNSMIVVGGFEDSSSTTKTHVLSGYDERADFATSGLTRVGMISVYDDVLVTAGQVAAADIVTTGGADFMAVITVVLAPDAGTVHAKTGGAAAIAAGSGAKEMGALEPPADIYNLTTWHLTTPVDDGGEAEQIEQPALDTYASEFFYLDESDRMVCIAPSEGATTSGSDGTRTELRNREPNYALTAFDPLTTELRQLTITTRADPTSITGGSAPRQEGIIYQIHGATGTPPLYLAAEWTSGTGNPVTPRIRLFLSGTGMSNTNVVTGISTTTDITIRCRVEDAVVSLWVVAGQVGDLPGTPTATWDAADFNDQEDWYFKAGAYNKTVAGTGSSGAVIAKISHFELIQPGDAAIHTKTGGAAAAGAGSGAKVLATPAVHVKTGGAAAPAAGVGAKIVTPPAVHAKTGGAGSLGAGTGARVLVRDRTGGAAAGGAGSGARSIAHDRTGGAAASAAGSGARMLDRPRTGGATATGAGSGTKQVGHDHDKTGGAAASGAGSGSREYVRSYTGGAAAIGAAVGAAEFTHATVVEKAGGAAATGAGVGAVQLGGAIHHSKTGGAATSGAGAGTSEIQHPAVHAKTGGGAATGAGSGGRGYVRSRTGGAVAAGAGTGAAQIVPAAVHTRAGGATATGAGGGALDLLTPTVHAKTGGAAAGGAGVGDRAITSATTYSKTGGAAGIGAGIALVEVIPPTTHFKAGGAVAVGAGTGRGRRGGALHAATPTAVGGHRAGKPYAALPL